MKWNKEYRAVRHNISVESKEICPFVPSRTGRDRRSSFSAIYPYFIPDGIISERYQKTLEHKMGEMQGCLSL
ncbi:MAG: hypothetical protein HPY80_08500 [Bacteroidales bacterium]|jgi:hypothetical protein|nr:hypothetical protein [Bacteroidales bacterium]